MTRTPDELDPDELDARWNDLTSRLGPLAPPPQGGVPELAAQVSPAPRGPRDYEAEDDEGAFEEPDPQLGEPNPVTALAWVAMVAGIVGAFVATFSGSAWLGALCLVLAVGGLTVLVVRLPRHSDGDDGVQV